MTSTDERVLDRMSSAQNAARVLIAFSGRPGARGVSELSRTLDLGKSTVHRILTALVAAGLVNHDPVTRTYRLSLISIDLAKAATAPLQLHDAVLPSLVRLHQRIGHQVHLGVLDGSEVVYVEELASRSARSSSPATRETRLPAHYSSCGKAIMAYLPNDILDDLLATHRFDARTANTIVDPHTFRRELLMTRARGWSRTVNEREMGVASIGVPVVGRCGQVVAAVGIIRKVEQGRHEELRCYVKPLQLTAAAIAQNIKTGAGAAAIRKVEQRIFEPKPNEHG